MATTMMQTRATHSVAFPSPLWEGVRGGGGVHGNSIASLNTPLPNPPPQGGREQRGFASLTFESA